MLEKRSSLYYRNEIMLLRIICDFHLASIFSTGFIGGTNSRASGVLAPLATTKYHRLAGLNNYFLAFWRLEVQDQGAG